MRSYVIDTNVLQVANWKAGQAKPQCVLACIKKLRAVMKSGRACVDAEGHVFSEYRHNASMSGQPGVGDAFFKWLHDRQGMHKHCELVQTEPRNSEGTEYDFFQGRQEFNGFDLSDRKFVVVALNSIYQPRVLNAVDSDWANFRRALERVRVYVEELCP